jgi:hypothetical protein
VFGGKFVGLAGNTVGVGGMLVCVEGGVGASVDVQAVTKIATRLSTIIG